MAGDGKQSKRSRQQNRYISVDLAVKTLLDAGYEEPAALVIKKWQDKIVSSDV